MIVLVYPSTSQSCTFSVGGHDFDLSGARASTDFTASDAMYTYVMNFCGNTVNSDCAQRTGMACQFEQGEIEAALWKSSDEPDAFLLDPSDPTAGLKLQWDNGDLCYQSGFMGPRHGRLNMKCGSTSDTTFTITESPTCTHNIDITLREACPTDFTPAGEGGLSGGSIFLILFFVFLILYFVGGFVFKTKRKGTTGMESIPNIDIWRRVPGLIKDGCQYTSMMIKTKGKGNAFYEEV